MTFDFGPIAPPAQKAPARLSPLQKLARRIADREAQNAIDRQEQRRLVKLRQAEGATWDEITAEAEISRPTLARFLKGL